jgi:succinoglycan biosynthesis protein ExoA
MMRPLPDLATVSVVVPAKGAADVVADAVASALAQDGVDEVVVAAGDDATRAAVDAIGDPRVRAVDNPSGRTPDALNAAIEASSGEVVVRLDAHAELPPGYVSRAVGTLRRTGAANVGGMQVPTADRGFAAAVAAAMRSPAGAGGATYRVGGEEGPADTVYLGVFRREALTAVGGFDPRFTRNQDAELNLRLRRAGFQVWFDPSLAVAYQPRDRVGTLASQYLQYGRWRRLTARTHAGSLAARQLAAPALVLGLVGATLLGAATGWWLVLGLAAAVYAAALVIAAATAVPVLRMVPATALALATMHLAWGVGFLLGPPRGTDAEASRAADTDGR